MNRIPPAISLATPPPVLPTTRPVEKSGNPYSLRHRQRPWVAHQKLVAISFLGDACVVFVSLFTAYLLRFETALKHVGTDHPGMEFQAYLGHVIFGGVLMMALLANFRLHDPLNFLALRRTVFVILKSCAIWFASFLTLALVFKIEPAISRVYCAVGCVILMATLIVWRACLHRVLRVDSYAQALRQKAVFIGWSDECLRAVRRLMADPAQQIEVVGVIAAPGASLDIQPPDDVAVLGGYHDMRAILRESGADVVMAVDSSLAREQMFELAEVCGKEFVDFKVIPNCFQILLTGLRLENFHGMPVLGVGRLPLHHTFNNALKRVIDIFGALVGLVLSAPVVAFFCLMVRLESRGPVIYRQRRIGLNGKPFDILKIRSMKLDAESNGAPGWTVKDDPRRLRVGAKMRAWNIDELPQFWNVLRGDMSLVGPRPERPELIEGFKEEIPHYNFRHNIKPGLTGWAQVNGLRGDTCLRERVRFDLDYIEKWSLLFDFKVLVRTFVNRSGAC